MVEAVLAYSTHEALGVRVRTRRTDRSADGFDADRREHLIEAGGELGVPVADPLRALFQRSENKLTSTGCRSACGTVIGGSPQRNWPQAITVDLSVQTPGSISGSGCTDGTIGNARANAPWSGTRIISPSRWLGRLRADLPGSLV